jgi:hypothetical protein
MSRFADKLKDALQVTPPAMGFFRAPAAASKPRMQLVAWAALEDAEKTSGLLEGADAAVITSAKPPTAKSIKALVKALGEAPLGLWAEDAASLKAFDSAGADFVVFQPEKMPLSAASGEKPGRVAGIPFDLADSLIHPLNDLPIDAVIINSPGTAVTFQDLMRFRRLGDFITKPLLGVVPADITDKEIKSLWDAGIDALVVSLTPENQPAFKDLKKRLAGLDIAAKRKWMKPRAIVPVVKAEEQNHEAEPDEGDGEDE